MVSATLLTNLISLLAWSIAVDAQDSASSSQSKDFPWDKVPTLPNVKWQACYKTFQCARLSVPLDYDAPEGKKASIALVRKPATVKAYSSAYQGPILVNPGGPGASGVSDVLSNGELLSQVVGPGFDIIGFDPRGIARSTPRVSFFKAPIERTLWDANIKRYVINDDSRNRTLATMYSRASVDAKLAESSGEGYLQFINTDNTARDMLTIVKALGKEKIQYWGFSYGTVLGTTFAAMFPDKIERMVLDGNINADDYYRGSWLGNIVDSDKTVQAFYDGCFAAGQTGCPFWKPSAAEIKSGLAKLFERMALNPLPVTLLDGRYGLVDHNLLRDVLAGAAYNPFDLFQLLARGLSDLENGNGTTIFALGAGAKADTACDTPEAQQFDAVREGGVSVNCNDVATAARLEDILTEYEGLLKVSSEWGPMIIVSKASCSNWPQYSKRYFRGPFSGNTSHPILFVGNVADPITPLRNAHKMAQGFPGSVVLTQDGPGHTSLAMPSTCTQEHVGTYFRTGALPEAGIFCPVSQSAFPTPGKRRTLVGDAGNGLAHVVERLARRRPRW